MINKNFLIDTSMVKRDMDTFSRENRLDENEIKELTFIVNSFLKFHSTIDSYKKEFSEKETITLFEDSLSIITNSYNNNGLQTKAYLYFKLLPIIDKIRTSSESKDTKTKTKTKTKEKSYLEQLASKSSFEYEFEDNDSYGMCGVSSSTSKSNYSSSYDYGDYSYGGCGGCGGSSGGSYGHC